MSQSRFLKTPALAAANRWLVPIVAVSFGLGLTTLVVAAPAKEEGRPPRIARAHDAQKREYWGLTAGPQRKPAPEPPTAALTPAAADAALEEDWLYQTEGKPLAERSRQELDWTGDILSRLAARGLDVAAARATLDALRAEHPTVAATEDAERAFYFTLRRFKRQLMFRHPEMDFDQLVLADIPYTKGMEWAHETMYRSGALAAVPGGRLLKITGLHPGAQPTKIAPAGEPAAFLNFDLSFDAAKVVYCMKPASHQAYHLYETDKSPYPLSEDLYLVSMRTGMVKDSGDYCNANWPQATQYLGFFHLYLLDIDGNRELIYRGAANVLYARPLRARRQPPVIASNVKWPGKKETGQPVAPAYFYSGNVREGLPEAVAKQVRYLRVLENIHRSYSVGIVHSGGGRFGSKDTSAWGSLDDVPELLFLGS